MDPAALKAEIETDPEQLGYGPYHDGTDEEQTGNDGAIVELLNRRADAWTPPHAWTKPAPVYTAQILQWAASGPRAKFEDASIPGGNLAVRSMALTCLDLLRGAISYVDTSDPAVLALLGGLVQAGVLDQTEVDALESLGRTSASRYEVLAGPGAVATLSDVSFALRGAR